MGLFSGVKKAFSSVASSAKSMGKAYLGSWGDLIDQGKDLAGSNLGKTALEGIGTYFGYPGLGSALGGFLGGSGSIDDVLSKASSGYSAKAIAERQAEDNEKQIDSIYGKNLALMREQNYLQQGMTDRANDQSVANAKTQMDFQERMASTQHQREITDLKAAGLNPILSGTGGMGNAAPSGSQAPVAVQQAAPMGQAMTSAFEAFRTMAEATKAQAATNFMSGAQTELTKSQVGKTQADTQLSLFKTAEVSLGFRNIAETYNNIIKTGGLIDAQASESIGRNALNTHQQNKIDQEIRNLQEQAKGLKMRGDIDASEYGRIMEMAKRAMDNVGQLPNLLKAVKGLIK